LGRFEPGLEILRLNPFFNSGKKLQPNVFLVFIHLKIYFPHQDLITGLSTAVDKLKLLKMERKNEKKTRRPCEERLSVAVL